MPIRMLRDWTDSDKINSVTVYAERFFTRLIMKVDDYGCFYADVRLLKANLFPLLLDAIREADLTRWMAECQKAGLIVLYESNNKQYLQIKDFKQRLDKARAKYPLPTENTDFPESVNEFPAETETEKKGKTETEGDKSHARTKDEIDLYEGFKTWIAKNAPRVNELKEPLTIDQYFKLRKKISKNVLTKVLTAMQNKKDLLKRYVSAYLTILNWSSREEANHEVLNGNTINERLKTSFKSGSDQPK